IPISTNLDVITHLPDSLLHLVKVVNGEQQQVNFQIETEGRRRLVWILEAVEAGKQEFKLLQKTAVPQAPTILASIEDGGIILGNAEQPLLRYNFATLMPPKGVEEVFKRSGFIHPLWSPSGEI